MSHQILSYYSGKVIQEQIVNSAKNKEAVIKYTDSFGKRPDIIQFEGDILDSIKKGATSFHISEEHWSDPLKLKPGMTKTQLDELRTTYDIILDIDSKNFEHSKICAHLLIEALKFHNIQNIGIKFSGNKGFHICISHQTLPKSINNTPTKLLFPDAVRITSSYLKELIKPHLAKRLQSQDPFSLVDIDSILISNRHLYRTPYSLHEKSGLVSLPIKKEDILTFKKEQAKPENIKTFTPFYIGDKEESKQLLIQAFDWYSKQKPKEEPKNQFEEIKVKINQKNFPPCIQEILNGIKQDGRKRALFILINFFKSTGYPTEDLKTIVKDWNIKNYEPLPDNYLQSQLNWHKTKKSILPPNCQNASYYLDLKTCKPDNLCKLIKNPVNYAIRKSRFKKTPKSS